MNGCRLVLAGIVWLSAAGMLSAQPPLTSVERQAARTAAPILPQDSLTERPIQQLEGQQRPLPRRGEAGKTTRPEASDRPSTTPVWMTLGGLVLAVLAIACSLTWIRRHGPAVLRPLPAEAIQPLGQVALARGAAIHLVRCGSRMLVLGVGADGIRTLAQIEDAVEVDLLAGACRRRDDARSAVAFAQLFQRVPAASHASSSPSTVPAGGLHD